MVGGMGSGRSTVPTTGVHRFAVSKNKYGPKDLPAFWRHALNCQESATGIVDSRIRPPAGTTP